MIAVIIAAIVDLMPSVVTISIEFGASVLPATQFHSSCQLCDHYSIKLNLFVCLIST